MRSFRSTTILLVFTYLVLASCSGGSEPAGTNPIVSQDAFGDQAYPIISQDAYGDQAQGSPDFGTLRAYFDDKYLYIQTEIKTPGTASQYNLGVQTVEGDLYSFYYFPDTGALEMLSPTSTGREPVELDTSLDQFWEIRIDLQLFDAPVKRIEYAKAMSGAITIGDEVTGGLVPNQNGEVAQATANPQATMVVTQQALATAGAKYSNQAAEQLREHTGALRFMTFNIYVGGAVENEPLGTIEDGRLPLIIETIEQINPDIIAFQELGNWNDGDPNLVEQVAQRLDMNYVYCDAISPLDTAIFTHYEIIDSDGYPELENCFTRAEIQVASGQTIQVFANHIKPDNFGCQKPILGGMLDIATPYLSGPAVMMGDFNISNKIGFYDEAIPMRECWNLLLESNWKLVAIDEIDLVFASDSLLEYLGYQLSYGDYETLGLSQEFLIDASDHRPVVWDVYLGE